MTVVSSRALLAALLLAVLPLSLPATAATPKGKPAAKSPAKATPPVRLRFLHQLSADKGEQLQKLVRQFASDNPGIEVELVQGEWSADNMPELLLLREAEAERLVVARRYKPLWQVMKDAGQPLPVGAAPRVVSPAPLDAARRLIALPVALSTPVMYYNREALSQAGVDLAQLPATWQGWQDVLGKLVATGSDCPYTTTDPVSVFIENTSAWNNQPYATARQDGLAVNGLIQVKHLGLMSTWYKSRYLRVFAADEAAEEAFASGLCATLTAPSGAYPSLVRSGKFSVGVAPFPYHADAYGAPQNTLADGPNLWVAAGKSAAEYRAVARLVSHWLAPRNQLEWQVNAGYLPLSRAGQLALGSRLLDDKLIAVRIGAAQLTHKPVNNGSAASSYARRAGVRQILDDELNAVWEERKNPKEALDSAVERTRRAEAGCCQPSAPR